MVSYVGDRGNISRSDLRTERLRCSFLPSSTKQAATHTCMYVRGGARRVSFLWRSHGRQLCPDVLIIFVSSLLINDPSVPSHWCSTSQLPRTKTHSHRGLRHNRPKTTRSSDVTPAPASGTGGEGGGGWKRNQTSADTLRATLVLSHNAFKKKHVREHKKGFCGNSWRKALPVFGDRAGLRWRACVRPGACLVCCVYVCTYVGVCVCVCS